MPDTRAFGEHLGYLAYHVEAIKHREQELQEELEQIEDESKTAQGELRAKKRAFSNFHHDVAQRLAKVDDQVENTIEDASDTAHKRAVEIRDSAITMHLEDTTVVNEDGFQSANNL